MAGEINMKDTVFMIPCNTNDAEPALIKADPINPPISACEELVGNPKYQVMMSQRHAPMSVAKIM